jgi:glycosyltransferase involved in cell wall biosynthesis
MKITIVTGAFFPVPPLLGGAVEKVWFALGPEFVRRGHQVTHFSRAYADLPPNEKREGVEHRRIGSFAQPASIVRLKLLDLLYSLRVRCVLPRADILVTNTFWLPLLLRNSRRGQLYVHVARFPKGQTRFYTHAARLQAPSSVVAAAIVAEAPRAQAKTKVIPYPRPTSSLANPPPLASREKKILYVGRIHPEKGVHFLLQAFVALPPALRAGWKMIIVGSAEVGLGGGGESYQAELQRSAADAQAQVEFRGPIFDEEELERVYRAAQLFVYPSLAEKGETFGLAPLEAMAHGCAVLVSALECFRDFICDGQTGFVFDHRAPDVDRHLRNEIARILEDEPARVRVADAGRRKSDEYALPRIAEQFLDDFASLRNSSPIYE